MNEDPDAEQAIWDYQRERALYESLMAFARARLELWLHEQRDEIAQIDSRIKTPASLKQKIARRAGGARAAIDRMNDLIGLRVVTYHESTMQVVLSRLQMAFEVANFGLDDKTASTPVREFGYRSIHLIARLPAHNRPEGIDPSFSGKNFEIQIRSVMQHAWATMSHHLVYKQGRHLRRVDRGIAALSAMLELADAEFLRIAREIERSGAERPSGLSLGDSMDAVRECGLDELFLSDLAKASGFCHWGYDAEIDDDQRYMHDFFRGVGIQSKGELVEVLRGARKGAADVLKLLASQHLSPGLPELSGGRFPLEWRDEVSLAVGWYLRDRLTESVLFAAADGASPEVRSFVSQLAKGPQLGSDPDADLAV